MRTLVMLVMVSSVVACSEKESAPRSSATGSAAEAPTAGSAAPATPPPATGSSSEPATPSEGDAAAEVAALVVHDVGSPALGNQKIEAGCVSVTVLLAENDWTVAAARLKDCGDKTARSILWVFKRKHNGKWNEDYLGQPPKCWKGVPADIAAAVAKVTKIPSC